MSNTGKLAVVETIDVTPTWASMMPILIAAVRDGTAEGQRIAEDELMRLARCVDEANAQGRAS